MSNKTKPEKSFITKERLEPNSKRAPLLKRIIREIEREDDKRPPQPCVSEQDKTFSILGHQVVGAEEYQFS